MLNEDKELEMLLKELKKPTVEEKKIIKSFLEMDKRSQERDKKISEIERKFKKH